MGRFTGRTAVVTGAGRGIGEAIARSFAAEGAQVAVISRTEANSTRAADGINAECPGAAHAFSLDVADTGACLETGKAVIEALGGQVDILVNNAGITRDGLFMRMKEEQWDEVIDTNLKGAFNMVKAMQRPLLKSAHGRLINISSVIGLIGNAGQANYAASKAGLIGLTRSLAREFAARKVTANCIAPGFITTDMTRSLNETMQQQILEKIPLKDFGRVEDISEMTLFLASDAGRYITGQVLSVDGGMAM